MIAPGQAAIAAHGRHQFVLVVEQRRHHCGATGHIGRRLFDSQRHGLLLGQAETPSFMHHVAGRRLGIEPFPHQARMAGGFAGQRLRGNGLAIGHGPVQAQLVSENDIGQRGCGAHVAHQLAHECVQFFLVHDQPSSSRRPPSARVVRPVGGGRMSTDARRGQAGAGCL